ncbi:hypothetical protein V8C86DRAFT_2575031 [Haematococcus lacustris]
MLRVRTSSGCSRALRAWEARGCSRFTCRRAQVSALTTPSSRMLRMRSSDSALCTPRALSISAWAAARLPGCPPSRPIAAALTSRDVVSITQARTLAGTGLAGADMNAAPDNAFKLRTGASASATSSGLVKPTPPTTPADPADPARGPVPDTGPIIPGPTACVTSPVAAAPVCGRGHGWLGGARGAAAGAGAGGVSGVLPSIPSLPTSNVAASSDSTRRRPSTERTQMACSRCAARSATPAVTSGMSSTTRCRWSSTLINPPARP